MGPANTTRSRSPVNIVPLCHKNNPLWSKGFLGGKADKRHDFDDKRIVGNCDSAKTGAPNDNFWKICVRKTI